MTKEQEIYKNMKSRIFKAYGKFCIKKSFLLLSIKEAKYNDETALEILKRMETKGYIRLSNSRYNKGLTYIIERWI